MTKPRFTVTSFGYGHGAPPALPRLIVFDVRTWFRDPHIEPRLRHLTGEHPEIVLKVLGTDGVAGFLRGLREAFASVLLTGVSVDIAFGCVGGRHRSVVLADVLTQWMREDGWDVTVEHRDVDKPVLRH